MSALQFIPGLAWPDGKAIEVTNPKPDQLLHFAYAIIWRHVACASGRLLQLVLGAYEDIILSALLSGGHYDLDLLVGVNPLTVARQPVMIGVAPYRAKMGDLNVWHFTIGRLDFYLRTDARQFPASWRPYLANGNNPIILGRNKERGIHEAPKLFPILRRMNKSTWKG